MSYVRSGDVYFEAEPLNVAGDMVNGLVNEAVALVNSRVFSDLSAIEFYRVVDRWAPAQLMLKLGQFSLSGPAHGQLIDAMMGEFRRRLADRLEGMLPEFVQRDA